MTHTDYQGIAILLGAITALLTVVGGIVVQLLVFIRQGKMMTAGESRDAKIAEVHSLVNGQSKKLESLAEQRGFSRGEKSERKHPMRRKIVRKRK